MNMRFLAATAVVMCCVAPSSHAQEAPAAKPKPQVTGRKAEEAQAALAIKLKEAQALREEASAVTRKIGELASTGKLPQDQQGVQLLQDLVDQLKAINERTTRIEDEVAGIKSWIAGEGKSLPTLTKDVAKLKDAKWGNYVQFQYRSSDREGENDGFRMRRVRLGLTQKIDPRASMKVSFDLASSQFGSNVNEPVESTGQLKDAFVSYQVRPDTTAIGGRQPVPLGFEIERSSSEREFPERAQYNLTMFPGERSTGVVLRHGLTGGSEIFLGGMNALTINDPQQRTIAGPVGSRLATVAGYRFKNDRLSLGVSGLWGERFEQISEDAAVENETNDRRFVYLDGSYAIDPKLMLRTEWMWGHDRLPNAKAVAGNEDRDLSGGQVQLAYSFNAKNQLALRREWFDPDVDSGGDLFTGWGLAYSHWLNPGVRLTAAYEKFDDDAKNTDWQVTTLRVQFKF
jgi:hypothetical protein